MPISANRSFCASFMSVLIGGCQATSAYGPEEVRLLTNEELTELFSDTIISDSERSTLKEIFYADGRYESQSRVRYSGTFSIDDNEVCVVSEASGLPFCRKFARDESGRVLLVYSRNQAGERQGFGIPYKFTPLESRAPK